MALLAILNRLLVEDGGPTGDLLWVSATGKPVECGLDILKAAARFT